MNDSVFLADLTWPEAQSRISAGAPVILPLGATEQHGHHMPLNVDVVIPTVIGERVARATGGLVAPTLPYGNRSQPRSGGGPAFAGTINLSAHTFSLVVRDVIVELHRQKVRHIVLLNGHYENVWPSIEGIELALDAVGRDEENGLSILRMDHWEFVQPQTIERIFPNGFPGIELEHASVLETSLMLAIRPDQVDLGRALHDGPAKFRSYDRFPKPPAEIPPSGVLSMTEGASAEKGEWLLEDCVSQMVEIIKEEFQL